MKFENQFLKLFVYLVLSLSFSSLNMLCAQTDTTDWVKGKNATVIDKMPSFPGGQSGLLDYLSRSIEYPIDAVNRRVEGKVILTFIVGSDGEIRNIKVRKNLFHACDLEAVRVIQKMPKWEPGIHEGKAVFVEYTLPITFRLQKPSEPNSVNSSFKKKRNPRGF